MKFGLFIALLVFLASTNIFGQELSSDSRVQVKNTGLLGDESGFDIGSGVLSNNAVTGDQGIGTPSENVETTKTKVTSDGTVVHTDRKPTGEVVKIKVKPDVTIVQTENKPSITGVQSESKSVVEIKTGTKPDSTVVSEGIKSSVDRGVVKDDGERPLEPLPHQESNVATKPGVQILGNHSETHDDVKPNPEVINVISPAPIQEKPLVEINPMNDRVVHVSGNIVYVKYHSPVFDTVQYNLDDARFEYGHPTLLTRLPYAQDFIARQSRVILYVSTSKTIDPKLAFAKFPIKFREEHFPLTFDIDVELPFQQRGLLERADITLYFFVYINNLETRIDTFVPAGTSQILLQGTNRLVQKLDVYVKASGLEINGLFRGRFGSRYIRPGTSFQVFIIPEQSLLLRFGATFDSVAQLTITNVPAMYPLAFSLLVNHQMLKPNTKYYAIAYVVENGDRRLLTQEPIWVINEQKILVTSQVVFNVIPSPFILTGSVTRAMPSLSYLQPHSSLIIRIREVDSNLPDIIFKLQDIVTLPQVFQVNISSTLRFDPTKNYEMRALILDESNNIYMATLQPIPLLDDISRLILPVDDLLYYVSVRLHSSSNRALTYVPGSTFQVLVSESPDSPSKPIVSLRIDSISSDFREFQIQVPATAIQRDKSYYLIMIIEINGMITHVSKTLLISNNQPPPLVLQLPVLSLNLITGTIYDLDNRPAQWSSSSYANIFLLDSKTENPDKAVVQRWKVHLENDFPIRFELQLDFSRLLPDRVYRLQAAIDNGRNLLEYKPAASVLVLDPLRGILPDVRVAVTNVKTFQLVRGLIYINGIQEPLPEKGEVVVQLSSSPLLMNPSIIDEIHIKVEGRKLPLDFTMKLPLSKIDINAVYYFLVRYTVLDTVIVPVTQAFAFSPRNEATVVITLAKTPQIPITGQVTATGSPLILPTGSTLHLYITDNLDPEKPVIYSEVFLEASLNSLYEFTMNLDATIVQRKIVLYLRAEILYHGKIILSIPRPALLQITPGGEWNINLVLDVPTLLIGRIVSMSELKAISGELDVHIQIIERSTTNIVYVSHVRLDANLPQDFRIQLGSALFVRYPSLQARAIIKNCKGQVLFESGGLVDIHVGINVGLDLSVVLTDQKKFTELETISDDTAAINIGIWRLSVTGVDSEAKPLITSSTDTKVVVSK
jgi:uncharacterized lipoprotein YbaY